MPKKLAELDRVSTDGDLPGTEEGAVFSSRLLTTTEVAEYLRMHPNTVRKWADQGLLHAVRIGPRGDRRFDSMDLLRMIEFGAGKEPQK